MKNKILVIFIIFGILSCTPKPPSYVTDYDGLRYNRYGSYIEIRFVNDTFFSGELIEVKEEGLVLLRHNPRKCQYFEFKDFKKLKMQVAKPVNTYWAIPIFAVISISHGLYAGLTLPINLISTFVIGFKGQRQNTYNEETISKENLKKFARFPQGLPENIKLEDL